MCTEVWQPGVVRLNKLTKSNLYLKPNQPKATTPNITRTHISNTNENENVTTANLDSAVYDSGATSSCGRIGDNFQITNKESTKIFHMPNGATVTATKQAKLKLDLL